MTPDLASGSQGQSTSVSVEMQVPSKTVVLDDHQAEPGMVATIRIDHLERVAKPGLVVGRSSKKGPVVGVQIEVVIVGRRSPFVRPLEREIWGVGRILHDEVADLSATEAVEPGTTNKHTTIDKVAFPDS